LDFVYYTRGLFGLFVANEPPVNADGSVAMPESGVGLKRCEPPTIEDHYHSINVIPGEAEDSVSDKGTVEVFEKLAAETARI
jgi:hypothetical protein